MTHSLHHALIAAAFTAAALFPLRAADGRIPIASAPYTISSPGVYYLTRDLNGAGGTAITISASPVTLDLNGHAITNTANAVIATDQAQITIRNGTINATGRGVYLTATAAVTRSSYRVEDLTLSGGGITITNAVANPMEVRIARNAITGSVGGIVLVRANAGHIHGNQVNSCIGNPAVDVSNSSNLDISRNIVTACNGIVLTTTVGSHVDYNVISNGNFALALFSGSSQNSLDHNTVTCPAGGGCVGNGIAINGNYNMITANHLTGNGSYGLWFDSTGTSGNIYSGNSVPGNTLGGVLPGAGNQSGGGNCNGTTCS